MAVPHKDDKKRKAPPSGGADRAKKPRTAPSDAPSRPSQGPLPKLSA
jgi:hypothetical protein